MYKRVLIVKEGQWGIVSPESYQDQIEMYKEILDRAKDTEGNRMAMVEIVATAAEAERRAKTEADIVIFISRGMEKEAERFAKAFPRIKVIVFTGAIPEGKVIWVNKGYAADTKTIQNIVLRY